MASIRTPQVPDLYHRDQRSLEDDIQELRQTYEVDTVVTLLEDRELEVMCCQSMPSVVAANQIEWLHFPIRDKWIPHNTEKFLQSCVRPIAKKLRAGKRILVHCNGGKGRTGTVVGAVLMTDIVAGGNAHRKVIHTAFIYVQIVIAYT